MPPMWFICPYKVDSSDKDNVTRYPAMGDYSQQIWDDCGDWEEVEIPGNRCLVRVAASKATLASLPFPRLSHDGMARLEDVPALSLSAMAPPPKAKTLGDTFDAYTTKSPKDWRGVEARVK